MPRASARPSTRRNRPPRAGFSLVELLVAMVLIAIMMWPMLNNFLTGASGSLKTGDAAIATNLCSQALEIVRNKPFANLLPGGDPLLLPEMDEKAIQELVIKTFGEPSKDYTYFNERFERKLTLDPVEETETDRGKQPLYMKVIIHCSWRTRDGKKGGPLTFCTLIGNEAARFPD